MNQAIEKLQSIIRRLQIWHAVLLCSIIALFGFVIGGHFAEANVVNRAALFHADDGTGLYIMDADGVTQVGLARFAHGGGGVALPDPLLAGWNGVPVCEKLHEDADHRILRCTFPPSIGHERHFHNPHFGYAIAGGRMRITDADGTREVDLATGSSFASDGVAWHEVVNVGDSTVIYLIVEPYSR